PPRCEPVRCRRVQGSAWPEGHQASTGADGAYAMRRPACAVLVAPLFWAGLADAAAAADESRLTFDFALLLVLTLVVPVLFVIAGCIVYKWYKRKDQRLHEVRRLEEKKRRKASRSNSDKSSGSGARSQRSGSPARGRIARSQRSGSPTRSRSPQHQAEEGVVRQDSNSTRSTRGFRPQEAPQEFGTHAMQGVVPQEASGMKWVMPPESQLEWIVPQYVSQVDHNGAQVMFAVPAVRVMAVEPQASRWAARGQRPLQ
ncbi:unnamed protein product, partial [Prorocentrum cordatum]